MTQRPIKYRAWTGTTMEYRVLAGQLGAFYAAGLDPKDSACISPFNTIYSEQTPLMQFTGLHDKNGKEIWEGDVVEVWYGEQGDPRTEKPWKSTVVWRNGGLILNNPIIPAMNFSGVTADADRIRSWMWTEPERHMGGTRWLIAHSPEVIGNIYENPELLKP